MSADSAALEAALKKFEDLHPETIELSLGRILDLLEALGRPQDKLPPTIHVAGTNGKGSTCAYLRAMAEAAGLSVHVYTSPHLVRFNERIRLAGDLVEDEALITWLTRVYDALDGRAITRFEATTATAILAFSEVPADLLILEVGLGGRFDATNIVDEPALSVITPVDFDHKQFLGSDLAKIAYEKAGIIKPNRPVVSAIQARVCGDVIRARAEELDAPLTSLRIEDIEKVPETVALPGTHQRYNAALAGLAMRTLQSPKVGECAIWDGALKADWPARMQKLASGPLTELVGDAELWLDGGHNPHAATAIAELLREMGGKTVMVSAMIASKDHGGFFHAFKGVVDAVYTIPNAPGHAGADPEALANTARQFLPQAEAFASLEGALEAAAATKPDRILIGGSLYIAGEILDKNQQRPV
ncbi:MAG: folylpolyglutamate synthase/dihydrofolate synthase family protein [Pseudomonadota bacterium]